MSATNGHEFSIPLQRMPGLISIRSPTGNAKKPLQVHVGKRYCVCRFFSIEVGKALEKCLCSRDSRDVWDSRDASEPPECVKRRRIWPFFAEIPENLETSGDKTPFVMTPFFCPRFKIITHMEFCFAKREGNCSYSFRGLRIFFRCSYNFLLLSTRIQLAEVIPLRGFQKFRATTVREINRWQIQM